MFGTTPTDAILDGSATDAYFLRTEEALDEAGENPEVVAEITADQFQNEDYEVLAGVKDAATLFAEATDTITVESLPEGSLFNGGPVMRIKGNYREFARYETSLLGFLSHASGIATAAHEAVQAADGDATILSFGARHVHPSIAPIVERNALIGGVDGFSHVAAGNLLGREPSGTMPHALMLSLGYDSQERAWNAFNDAAPEDTPRIALCDTFTDEKDEVRRAVRELGDDLDGIRIDTTGSRRGKFEHIIKEVNWMLHEEDREDVDVFVSGGITPEDIRNLKSIVDGFGVGSYISNTDPLDFSLDIVEVNGESIAKRGKNSGEKEVHHINGEKVVVPAHRNNDTVTALNGETYTEDHFPDDDLMETIVADGDKLVEFDIDTANAILQEETKLLQGDTNE